MKVHLGKKRESDSLRPLSEKEIQKKLYGDYYEETVLKERIDSEFVDPLRKARVEAPSSLPKKMGVYFPWEKTFSVLAPAGQFIWSLVGGLLGRKNLGWVSAGVGVLALFLGVHFLNLYRTTAMKNPAKPINRAVEIKKEEPPLPEKTSPALEGESVLVLTPPTPAANPPAPPPPAPPPVLDQPQEKIFVVQVCTYARKEDADRLAEKMSQSGFPAFVRAFHRESGKTFYPVFLGASKTYRDAQAKLEEFRTHPISQDFQDIFIRSL